MKHQYLSVIFLFILTSCSSYKEFEHLSKEVEIPNKTFRATFVDTWTALKKVVEQYNLNLDVNSQEAGILKTFWNDNTMQVNFSDSFGGKDSVKEAKYKLVINVIERARFMQNTFYGGIMCRFRRWCHHKSKSSIWTLFAT